MNKDLPLVSIVTPSRNQVAYLERTIRSVLEQDYPAIEYLVIDGASTDGSQAIIHKYQKLLAFSISEPDCGQTDALNKGFAQAHGAIYAWINSDDVLRPGAVASAVRFLSEHPEVGMVYGDADLIDEQDRVIGKFPARQTDYRLLRQGYVHIPQQASFFRASLWKKVGPLDPSFYFAMDYDLWIRLARIAPLYYLPETWAGFRLHRDAKTIAADDRCWPEMIRVHRRDGGSWASLIVVKYLLRKVVAPLINLRRRRMLGS